MILIESEGQFGNRMFQLAFAYATAERFNTSFVISRPLHTKGPAQLFDLKSTHQTKSLRRYLICRWPIPRNLHHKLTKPLFARGIKHIFKEEEYLGHQAQQHLIQNHTHYFGYYQGVGWFSQYQKAVKQLFTVQAGLLSAFKQKYAHLLNSHYAVIHTRRKDYLTVNWGPAFAQKSVVLPGNYYLNNIARLQDCGVSTIVALGDDPAYNRQLFANTPVQVLDNTPFDDFLLMMHAPVLLASNSTFAWWAAYLNPSPTKIVFMPQHWFGWAIGQEMPKGIFDYLPTHNFKLVSV